SRKHRGIDNHADAALCAIRQNGFLDLAAQNGVRGLERSDRRDGLRALVLLRVKVGDANPADLAFLSQGCQCLPSLFQAGPVIGRRPMHLVQIDGAGLQAAEAVLALLADGTGGMVGADFAAGVPTKNTLGKNVGPRAAPIIQGTGNDLLRMAQAVNGSGVDPVDSEFESAVDGGDGIGVFLRAPGELPSRAADSPGAKTCWSDVKIGIAEFACLHISFIPQGESPMQSNIECRQRAHWLDEG